MTAMRGRPEWATQTPSSKLSGTDIISILIRNEYHDFMG